MSGNTINDGGPMFSRPNPNYDGNWDKRPTLEGASLRDWLAGQALAGLMSRGSTLSNAPDWVPQSAYAVADAMIAARSL